MDAISSEASINLNGKQYTLAKATVSRLEEFVDWCKPKLPNPITEAGNAIAKFPVAFHEMLVRVAVQEGSSPLTINSPRVQALASTPEGMAKFFHIMISPNHPEVTVDQIGSWIGNADVADLQRAFAKISGTAEQVGGQNPPGASQ